MVFVGVARTSPYLYRLMFVIPEGDPSEGARAAGRAREALFAIVAEVVGDAAAPLAGALLFSSAHGIAGLEMTGHMTEKMSGSPEKLLLSLVGMAAAHRWEDLG